MLRKKVCMLGSFAVGKTSLVRQFVHSMFSEQYKTTIGVKIDRKTVELDQGTVELALWDIQGDDEFQRVPTSYLRGTGGALLVCDPTREESLVTAQQLCHKIKEVAGEVPVLVLFNKADLRGSWRVTPARREELAAGGWEILDTSAKTGEGVEDAFRRLTARMIGVDG